LFCTSICKVSGKVPNFSENKRVNECQKCVCSGQQKLESALRKYKPRANIARRSHGTCSEASRKRVCNLRVTNKASWKIRGNGAMQGYTAIRNPGVYLIKSNPLLAYPLASSAKATPVCVPQENAYLRVYAFAVFRPLTKLRGVIMAFEIGECGIKCVTVEHN